MRTFPFVVNFAYFLFYAFTIYYDYGRTEEFQDLFPIPGNFWTKFVWLTFVNLIIQLAYHGVGSYISYTTTSRGNPSELQRAFHFAAVAVVFPVAVSVVILFWGLVYLDPDFLLTDEAKLMLSVAWYNHALHTVPLIAMTVDFFAWHHPQPKITSALKAIIAFVAFYLTDIHLIYFYTGKWGYPILAELELPNRIGFYVACIGVLFINFLIGYGLNYSVGPIGRPVPKPRKKKN